MTDRTSLLLRETFQVCVEDRPFREEAPTHLPSFLTECRRQGLLGGLGLALIKYGHPNLEFVSLGRMMYKREFFQHAQYETLLNRLEEQLGHRECEVLLLKGASLNREFYRKPGVRHVSDVDLFVTGEQFPLVHECLAEIGFSCADWRGNSYSNHQGLLIDIHLNSFGRSEESSGLNATRVWDRSRLVGNYRFMAIDDQILYFSLHALKHSYARAVWLWDILHCLEAHTLKPTQLGKGDLRVLAYALHQLEYMLGRKFESNLKVSLFTLERKLLKGMLTGSHHPLGQVMLALCQESWLSRLSFATNALRPESGSNPYTFGTRGFNLGLRSLIEVAKVLLNAPGRRHSITGTDIEFEGYSLPRTITTDEQELGKA